MNAERIIEEAIEGVFAADHIPASLTDHLSKSRCVAYPYRDTIRGGSWEGEFH
jgi:hypothetical protein